MTDLSDLEHWEAEFERRERWEAEFARMRDAQAEARRLRWLRWRLRVALILWRPPYNWRLSAALDYAASLCGDAIHEVRERDEDMLTPREALDSDMQHWDD